MFMSVLCSYRQSIKLFKTKSKVEAYKLQNNTIGRKRELAEKESQ